MNWRRTFLTTVLVGGCAWCLGMVQKVHSEEKTTTPNAQVPFKPVSPVEPLMEAQNDAFNAIKKQLAAEKQDFKLVQRHAYVLAELCNVNHYQNDKADYKKWAFEARDLAVEMASAAKAKDAAKAKELFKQINTRCGACHDAYK